MGVAISGLVAGTVLNETDVFEIEQAGVSKQITKAQLRKLMFSDPAFAVPAALPQNGDVVSYSGTDFVTGAAPRWRVVPAAAYTATAVASSSTITFSGAAPANGINLKATDYFSAGLPVRVVIGITTYYGICHGATTSTILLAISGASLPLSTAITSLSVGTVDMVKTVNMAYGNAASASAFGTGSVYTGFGATVAIPRGLSHRWHGASGYLVSASAAHTNVSSTTVVNFKMNAGTNVLTSGLTPAAGGTTTQGAFVDSALGDIIAANAVIADRQTITTVCTNVGGAAESLVACLTFVVP